jgi:hypothetical protein
MTTHAEGGTAIAINGGHAEGMTNPGPDVRNVVIRGDTEDKYWTTGIDANDAAKCTFTHVEWIGGAGMKTPTAFRIRGMNSPTDHYLTNCRADWFGKAVHVEGTVEGVTLTACTFVSGARGVSWETTGPEPLLSISGTHINTYEYCVYGNKCFQSFIVGNLLYQDPGAAGLGWAGVLLENAEDTVIANNLVHGWDVLKFRNGIVAGTGSNRVVVRGNTIRGKDNASTIDSGIWFTQSATDCRASENLFAFVANNYQLDSPTSVVGQY